jgi:signal transduction histidine kinase
VTGKIIEKPGESTVVQLRCKHKDGSWRYIEITSTNLLENPHVGAVVSNFHDITHQKELDHAKDDFIALASHELRTPMTAIKGFLSMIMKGDYGPVNESLKKPLENIQISSERQIHLINDLLDVSRLQTGRINYNLSNFSLKPVMTEVVDSLQSIATQKGIALNVTGDDSSVQSDSDWTKQVLNNLIGNALKFTDKGSITLNCKSEGDVVLISVTDTGMGIKPEDQGKLFERFHQLHTTKRKYVGSGLGLYISKEVARKMGGDLILEKSAVDVGSTFVFSLPKADTEYAKKLKETIQKDMQIAFKPKAG